LTGKSSTAAEPHEKLENENPTIRRRENNFSNCNPWTTQTSKQVPQLQRTGKYIYTQQ
jgi:hypothetical protein